MLYDLSFTLIAFSARILTLFSLSVSLSRLHAPSGVIGVVLLVLLSEPPTRDLLLGELCGVVDEEVEEEALLSGVDVGLFVSVAGKLPKILGF